MIDAGLLPLRVTVGLLLAGHGSQKLFGSFGGPGMKGTTGWLQSMGFRPARFWAGAAGMGEFAGGVLNVLGLLNPIGPLSAAAVMAMATAKSHWGKPVWVTSGGAELPLTNIAAAGAIALAGPGAFSLDRALGIRLPKWLAWLGLGLTVAMTGYGVWHSNRNLQQGQEQAPEERLSEPVLAESEVATE